ncbi:TetR family transcriptional regulator [Nonomuraea turkmeniaca]|uniref:TetR family transcriptional regulator n=1 Tax=Nonomuraea turkmeniaca TaxID=103838 RepID=A0A5S4EU53_9ACTN|nr:TetR/AcrR family transcriptional regulator [Nonomuraea turkmeniaca]TMR03096.1 TetR family transcriptional regulator [Nonomuraea turkmeniaca]
MVGLRERKKERTRRALIEAALRLFEEKGYAETTLAEIAAEAEVSTRTFFSYFSGKEDLVYYDSQDRLERALELMATRRPEEAPTGLLHRLVDQSIIWAVQGGGLTFEEAELRTRLVMTEPSLQARGLLLLFDSQVKLAKALHDAFPGELDLVEAASAVGALIGAMKLAMMANLENVRSINELVGTARRAAELTLDGLRALDERAASRARADQRGIAS